MQDLDERHVAVDWMALEVPDECPCPTPGFRSTAPIDGGGAPPPDVDGGAPPPYVDGGFDIGYE